MAVQGKGLVGMMRRARRIVHHYGLTPARMDRILHDFVDTLRPFNCAATFPITAVALARSKGVVEKYLPDNIEFAVHGYYHVDHSRLTLAEQVAYLERTRHLFHERGMAGDGFRSPYLRWSNDTMAAVRQNGFLYDSSQALYWDVMDGKETESYRQVLQFYRAVPAQEYPALPYMEPDSTVVRIPYCLPDDEALIDRLGLESSGTDENPWLKILAETSQLGELFTLGLHPERINLCKPWLTEVLHQARQMTPDVWMTRLDEVARWWRARMETDLCITQEDERVYRLDAQGPEGLTLLARDVKLLESGLDWDGRYQAGTGPRLVFESPCRPFIGVSPGSDPALSHFLRQQGYIVEPAPAPGIHSIYLDLPHFTLEAGRPLLAQIEEGEGPLVRLGRWPNRAKSALVVTGDVDALTIWDYGLRLFGT